MRFNRSYTREGRRAYHPTHVTKEISIEGITPKNQHQVLELAKDSK